MVVLSIVFGISICLIAAFTGLAIGDEESVQAFGLIWLFPLTFLSSAFVPIYTMPGWLQAFANNQPVTFVVNTMRALALGGPIEANFLKSVAWLAGSSSSSRRSRPAPTSAPPEGRSGPLGFAPGARVDHRRRG